ncbi:MAG: adenylate/guanylate cyclase domain-containing protein [Acidimicrobiia bacterium]
MRAAPSGTVTFLFTDVAGSTRLWETDRESMAADLGVHDRILRDAIDRQDGYLFATGGDSFSAAFPTATLAVEAATSSQLELSRTQWKGPGLTVRMGIHTGTADERDGNYFGPHVGRAARIMSLGNGGQILVSAATVELVGGELDGSMSVVDLGLHDLKDIQRRERVYELRHSDLPVIDRPMRSLVAPAVRLPEQLTSFVGRTTEIQGVLDLLEGSRLVTLTGVGGTGKTRLAIEAARSAADRFPDGVWMTELESVSDDDQVLFRIAGTWDLRPGEGATLQHVVTSYLAERQLLLVLDNCEHVLDGVSTWARPALSSSPGLCVLATSRETLGVQGESVFPVPSLALPTSVDTALESEAVSLFLERFKEVRPGYQPTEEDLKSIVRVCRRLDGIPLGLELAASRLRTLTPLELEIRLEDSFRILSGSKAALPRQRTLEATIDWSHKTLDEREAELFRKASVFSGGFDLAAIEDVVKSESLETWEIVDVVDQLHDKSLLTATSSTAGSRFRMLEPIRVYARDRLKEAGEVESTRRAHASYYVKRVAELSPELRASGQKKAHEAISNDLDNLRQALAYLRDAGQTEAFLRTYFDLAVYWAQASMHVEALQLALPVLDAEPNIDASVLTKAWWTASTLAFGLTDPRSVEYGERSMTAALSGDPIDEGWAATATALAIFGTTNRKDAQGYLEAGKRLIGHNLDQAWWSPEWDEIYLAFADIFMSQADPPERLAAIRSLVELAKSIGDEYTAAFGMVGASFVTDEAYRPDVERMLEEAVRILDDLDFRHALGHGLIYWGAVTKDQDDGEAGDIAVTRGASILAEIGDIPCAVNASIDMIDYQLGHGQVDKALAHLVFAARQSGADPSRFASRLAAVSCRLMVVSGDLRAAATLLGFIEAREASGGACRDMVMAGLDAAETEELLGAGLRLSDADILGHISTWAAETVNGSG